MTLPSILDATTIAVNGSPGVEHLGSFVGPSVYDHARAQSSALPLYQLIETHFDTFEQVYDEAFSQEYGFWRPVVRQTVDKYLACGDYRCGVARVFCENCATDYFVPFSCKGRGLCPSCTQRRVLTRAEDLIEGTFQPVPHRHLVVSLPKALRKAFLYNRDLLQKLPGLAWRAYFSVLQTLSGHPDGRAGGVLCNHTFSTSDLTWHPHVCAAWLRRHWVTCLRRHSGRCSARPFPSPLAPQLVELARTCPSAKRRPSRSP